MFWLYRAISWRPWSVASFKQGVRTKRKDGSHVTSAPNGPVSEGNPTRATIHNPDTVLSQNTGNGLPGQNAIHDSTSIDRTLGASSTTQRRIHVAQETDTEVLVNACRSTVGSLPPGLEEKREISRRCSLDMHFTQRPDTSRVDRETLPDSANKHRTLLEEWQALRRKHEQVVGTRVRATELETRLRTDSKELHKQEFSLVEKLRAIFRDSQDPEIIALFGEFDLLQQARERLQPLEKDHQNVAARLIFEEWELTQLESRMYVAPVTTSTGIPEGSISFFPDDQDATESVASTTNIRSDRSPEALQYLSTVGQVDLLRERLMDLRLERAQLLEEREIRAEVGTGLDEYSKGFLESFDSEHVALIAELKSAEEAMSKAKDALHTRDDPVSSDEAPADLGSSPGISAAFGVPVPDDGTSDEDGNGLVFSNVTAAQDTNIIDSASYINAWLLHGSDDIQQKP